LYSYIDTKEIVSPPVYLVVLAVLLTVGFVRQRNAWRSWRSSLGITDPNAVGLADAYTTRTRFLRFGAVAMVLVTEGVWLAATQRPLPGWFQGLYVLIGAYMLAVLLSSAWIPRAGPSGTRAAVLRPRLVTDHVDTPIVKALWALPATALAVAAIYVVLPMQPDSEYWARGEAGVAVAGLIAVAVSVVTYGLLRSILRRPQPHLSPEVLRVDDAIRTASLRAIGAAGVAVLLQVVAIGLSEIAWRSALDVSRTLGGLGALACLLATPLVWFRHGRPIPVEQAREAGR
jgi:hypothetical protein